MCRPTSNSRVTGLPMTALVTSAVTLVTVLFSLLSMDSMFWPTVNQSLPGGQKSPLKPNIYKEHRPLKNTRSPQTTRECTGIALTSKINSTTNKVSTEAPLTSNPKKSWLHQHISFLIKSVPSQAQASPFSYTAYTSHIHFSPSAMGASIHINTFHFFDSRPHMYTHTHTHTISSSPTNKMPALSEDGWTVINWSWVSIGENE